MAQYGKGTTVTVTNGSNEVVGAGTAFVANAHPGNWFVLANFNLVYFVTEVIDDTHLLLDRGFEGVTASGATYGIVGDFTPFFGLPLINPGDINPAALIGRGFAKIDQLLNNAVVPHSPILVPEGGTGAQSFTQHGLMVGNGAGALQVLAPLAAGAMLIGGGASANPTALAAGTAGTILQMVAGAPAWVAPTPTLVGLGNVANALQLVAANNLSDLVSATTARSNLGLGSMATQAAGAVAITGGTAALTSLTVPTIANGAGVTVGGVLLNNGGATFTGNIVITGDVALHGSFTQDTGAFTTVTAGTLHVGDSVINMLDGVTGTPSLNAALQVTRGSQSAAQWQWNETGACWQPVYANGGAALLATNANPTGATHVGNRGFNDGRYVMSVGGVAPTAGNVALAATGRIGVTGVTISTTAEANTLSALGATGANIGSVVGAKSGEALGVKRLRLTVGGGAVAALVDTDSNYVDLTITGVPNGATQMMSATDTTPGYAVAKLLGTTGAGGITVTKGNPGANETLIFSLANSSITIGSTPVSLGGTVTSLAGLTSLSLSATSLANIQVGSTTPYIGLMDSTWGALAFMQAGTTATGSGPGNYLLTNVPTGKGYSWAVNNVSQMQLQGGNLALGLAPSSAWGGGGKPALEVGFAGSAIWSYSSNDIYLLCNSVWNGGWTSPAGGYTSFYNQSNGAHSWGTNSSVAVGGSFTPNTTMTLSTNGWLCVGATNYSDGSLFQSPSFTPLNAYRATSGVNSGIIAGYSDYGGTMRLQAYFNTNGGLANFSNNNTNISDIRTKTRIARPRSYLDTMRAVEVMNFAYMHDPDGEPLSLGVIAQQVEEVAPEFVNNDGFGETPEDGIPLKTIYETDLHYGTLLGLQELATIVDDLRAEFAAFKKAA